jgi:ankyrin repeat protein
MTKRLQDMPPEIRAHIYKKLDRESLLKFGESGARFIPEILRVLPKAKWREFWFGASQNGFCKWLHVMIKLGFPVNKKDWGDNAALYYATRYKHLDCLKELIAAGADVKALNTNGATALHYAAYWGSLNCLKELIAAGANVNATDNYGWTVLQYAAHRGYLDSLKELIAAGADVNATNKQHGNTALHYAARCGYLDCFKELIAAGADVNAKNNRGETALDICNSYMRVH